MEHFLSRPCRPPRPHLSNKEIAAALHMAASTVEHHLERIFVKLGAKDRTQAAAAAVQRGIVQLET